MFTSTTNISQSAALRTWKTTSVKLVACSAARPVSSAIMAKTNVGRPREPCRWRRADGRTRLQSAPAVGGFNAQRYSTRMVVDEVSLPDLTMMPRMLIEYGYVTCTVTSEPCAKVGLLGYVTVMLVCFSPGAAALAEVVAA